MTTEAAATQPAGELPAAGDTTPTQRVGSDHGHGTTLSLKEAAQRLGVHEQTVRRAVKAGKVPGAHTVPHGKGEQWRVPVAALEALSKQTPVQVAEASETEQLRQRVAVLEQQLELQRALADERRHQLDQLHQTMRALSAGVQPPDQAVPVVAQPERKRWWRRA
jgi:excisionase family DNA binding protein